MSRCIVTYAAGAHEELLDVALPTYRAFADRHGYDLIVGKKMTELPPAWNKVPLLIDALAHFEEVVWFDCDLIVVDPSEDFPPLVSVQERGVLQVRSHAMVRHFEDCSEVPNSGVWRLRLDAIPLLAKIMELEVFTTHGWFEQAALLTLMGYAIPPEGSHYPDTKCRCVQQTRWYKECQFMRLRFNSHPNYRAERPAIVHCSYESMPQRLEVMRALVRNPAFDYPKREENKKEEIEE